MGWRLGKNMVKLDAPGRCVGLLSFPFHRSASCHQPPHVVPMRHVVGHSRSTILLTLAESGGWTHSEFPTAPLRTAATPWCRVTHARRSPKGGSTMVTCLRPSDSAVAYLRKHPRPNSGQDRCSERASPRRQRPSHWPGMPCGTSRAAITSRSCCSREQPLRGALPGQRWVSRCASQRWRAIWRPDSARRR